MDEKSLQAAVEWIVARLDQPISLANVSEAFNTSPHHFHRELRSYTGESFAKYVERLRLSRAAQHLLLRDDPLIDVGLNCGYQRPETFTRAFRRFFNQSPSRFRQSRQHMTLSKMTRQQRKGTDYQISQSHLCRTRELSLVTQRHTGPYEAVPDRLWHELSAQIDPETMPLAFVGLGWDSTADTAEDNRRFDAGIIVNRTGNPSLPVDPLIHPLVEQTLPADTWVVTLHAGPYTTLTTAYPEVMKQALSIPGVSFAGLPGMEIYHTDTMKSSRALNFTEIYLRVKIT